MTGPGVGTLASQLVRRALDVICGCADRRWKLDVSREFGGVTLRAEVRSD